MLNNSNQWGCLGWAWGKSYTGLFIRSVQLNGNGQKTLRKLREVIFIGGGAWETTWCHVITGHTSSSWIRWRGLCHDSSNSCLQAHKQCCRPRMQLTASQKCVTRAGSSANVLQVHKGHPGRKDYTVTYGINKTSMIHVEVKIVAQNDKNNNLNIHWILIKWNEVKSHKLIISKSHMLKTEHIRKVMVGKDVLNLSKI